MGARQRRPGPVRCLRGARPPFTCTLRWPGRRRLRALRHRMQMIFQDPFASPDPCWRTGDIVAEPLLEQGLIRPEQAPARAAALLASVGLAGVDLRRFPHQFSCGQRQRTSIARAVATSRGFLVFDEPTCGADVR